MLCDHQCSFATPDYLKAIWRQLESEEAVGKAYSQYLQDALAKPYILGYHRYQYIDRFIPRKGVLKQGLLREDGTAYETLTRHIREADARVLRGFAK